MPKHKKKHKNKRNKKNNSADSKESSSTTGSETTVIPDDSTQLAGSSTPVPPQISAAFGSPPTTNPEEKPLLFPNKVSPNLLSDTDDLKRGLLNNSDTQDAPVDQSSTQAFSENYTPPNPSDPNVPVPHNTSQLTQESADQESADNDSKISRYTTPNGQIPQLPIDNQESDEKKPLLPSSLATAAADDEALKVSPSKQIATLPWAGLTLAAIISVLIDAFYQYFLFISGKETTMSFNEETKQMDGAIYNLIKHLGGNPDSGKTHDFLRYFPYALLIFIFGNAAGDLTAVDPVQDIYDILTNKMSIEDYIAKHCGVGKTHIEKLTDIRNRLNWFQKNTPGVFLWISRILITFLNYVVLSGADGIAVAGMSNNPSKEGILVTTGLAAFFGSLYYALATDGSLKEHCIKFCVKLFSKKESMLLDALRSPSKSIEAFWQVFSNILYRAFAAGYMSQTLINAIHTAYTGKPFDFSGAASMLVALPVVGTGITTALSRGLRSINPIFAEEAEEQYLRKAKLPVGRTVMDVSFVTLRSACVSYFVYRISGNEEYRLFYSTMTGLLIGMLGVHASVTMNHNAAALTLQKEAKMLADADSLPDLDLDTNTPEELFNIIVESKKPSLETPISIINAFSRIIRGYVFLGFTDDLLRVFFINTLKWNLNLNPLDIIIAGLLTSADVQKNDMFFYLKLWVESWANWATRKEIWGAVKNNPPLRLLDGAKVNLPNWPRTSIFFAAKHDYNPKLLKEIIERTTDKREEDNHVADYNNLP